MKQNELEKISDKIKFEMEVLTADFESQITVSPKIFYRVLAKLLMDVKKANLNEIKKKL